MLRDANITIISMCKREHADVWKLTSELLLKNVEATEYIVYVPEEDISFFEGITNNRIKIKNQKSLGKGYYYELAEKTKIANNKDRFGWYLQQFYKIEALTRACGDIVVIWDADCVPASRIKFIDDFGRLTFMDCSTECHGPYFENIERLLSLRRVQKNSFVIPGFPFRKEWVVEFVTDIESKNQATWYNAIMKSTDFSLQSGFSETETLGTWMANSHASEWTLCSGRWERLGQSRFGFARDITPVDLINLSRKHDLQIISFENWDLKDKTNLLTSLKRLALKLLKIFA